MINSFYMPSLLQRVIELNYIHMHYNANAMRKIEVGNQKVSSISKTCNGARTVHAFTLASTKIRVFLIQGFKLCCKFVGLCVCSDQALNWRFNSSFSVRRKHREYTADQFSNRVFLLGEV